MAGSQSSDGARAKTSSLADVAARAGVSASLVSRILRGDGEVRAREETRERVLAAAEELAYVPHQLARNLRNSNAGAIGLVMHDMSHPIYSEIIRGAQQVASAVGSVLLLVDDTSVGNPTAVRQFAGGGRVDGLLWQMAGHVELDAQVAEAARYTPIVLLNSRGTKALPGVHLDDERAVRMAMRHLLELGHRRIGFISGLPTSDVSDRRRLAYRRSLTAAGIKGRPAWEMVGGWDPEDGQRAMQQLLKARPAVTAVVVTNSIVATGTVTAIQEAGLRAPDDISVISIHDLWFAPRLTPPLTVVGLPLREMGRRAAELVLTGGRGGKRANDVLIKEPAPELIVRGSTAPPAS